MEKESKTHTNKNTIWNLLKNPAMFPIMIGTTLSFIILAIGSIGQIEEEQIMDSVGWISIVVALIGVAGTLLGLFIQFRKDSHTIADVKVDTAVIKPKTDTIDENVKHIRTTVTEKMALDVSHIRDDAAGIQELLDETRYQKRVKDNISTDLEFKDALVHGVDKLYEENAALREQVRELSRENVLHKQRIKILEGQINRSQDYGITRE